MSILLSNKKLVQPSGGLRTSKFTPIGEVLNHVFVGSDLGGHDRAGKLCLPPDQSLSLRATSRGIAVINNTGAGSSAYGTIPLLKLPIILVFYGWWNGGNGWVGAALTAAGHSFDITVPGTNIVQLGIRFNYGTQRALQVACTGSNSQAPVCAIVQAFSDTDYRIYANGTQANGTLSCGTVPPSFNSMLPIGNGLQGGVWLVGVGGGKALTDAQALEYTSNPQKLWEMFEAPHRFWLDAVAAGGNSAALLGNGASLNAGNPVPELILATTGQVSTFAENNPSPELSLGTSGQTVNAAAGNTAPVLNLGLLGQPIASSFGNLAAGATISTTGHALSSAVGILSAAVSAALSGVSCTSNVGNLSVAGSNSAALNSNQANAVPGLLTPSVSKALAGNLAQTFVGAVAVVRTAAIAGNGSSFAQGALAAALSISLSGSSVTASVGNLEAPENRTAGLTGSQAASNAGTFAVSLTVAIAGVQSVTHHGVLASFSMTSPSASRSFIVSAESRAYDLLLAEARAYIVSE